MVFTPAIPKTQTAVVFEENNGPIIVKKDHPVTQPKDLKNGEALVKLEYSGVCHTDLHAWKGDWPVANKKPLVGGHEGVGKIVAIADHTTTHLKVGDTVAIKWLATSCLDCGFCLTGEEATCPEAQCSGFSVDGSFQQYAVSYTNHLTKVPDGVPLEEAAPIACAGVTVWKAIKQSNTRAGDWIVIAGAGGGLGHLAVQYAVAQSLRVIAIDTGAEKKKLCESYGVTAFLDFKEGNLVQRIKDVADGVGPHAAVIASAGAAAYNEALEYLRPRGTLVAVGLPADTYIKANVFFTVFKALRIVGSYVGNRQDANEAYAISAMRKVKPIIEVVSLDQVESVYKRMEAGAIAGRIVLKCT